MTSSPALIQSQYNPTELKAGIVHIGVGAFHRAHQAMYIDRLMDQTHSKDWGIIGINMRAESLETARRLNQHQGDYILKTIHTDGNTKYQKIRSILEVLDWSNQQEEAIFHMASQDTKLITITITESGYYLDEKGNLDEHHPDILEDLIRPVPITLYGCLYQGMMRRFEQGSPPITIQSCDNIRKNGTILKRCFQRFIEIIDNALLQEWLEQHAYFPNSMVDRITPKPTESLMLETQNHFGIDHDATVLAEEFHQWVIEDKYANSYPDLTVAGAQIVTDVDPFEEAKIRILNGGHTALAYFGVLHGYKTFDEALADENLSNFFDDFQHQEVLPGLPMPSPVEHHTYLSMTKLRFQNRYISDSLERICMDGASKFPLFILPTIKANLQLRRMPIFAIRAIASWYVFMRKVNTNKIPFPYIEPKWHLIKPLLDEQYLSEFTHSRNLWSDIPSQWPRFPLTLNQEIRVLIQQYDAIK